MKATITTNKGVMVVELYDETPIASGNFSKLAKDGIVRHKHHENAHNKKWDCHSREKSVVHFWRTGKSCVGDHGAILNCQQQTKPCCNDQSQTKPDECGSVCDRTIPNDDVVASHGDGHQRQTTGND